MGKRAQEQGRKTFRATSFRRGLAALTLVLFLGGFLFFLRVVELGWITVVFGCLAAAAILAVIEAFRLRISLEDDGIEIATLLGRRQIPREQILSARWEAGCGVSLQLTQDRSLVLPDTGHDAQGVANSLRAWLRRTEASANAPSE
jgi:Bacterial PH domain